MISDMVCIRLERGADLREEIEKAAADNGFRCGAILNAVGCVSKAKLRCADGKTVVEIDEPCEIVSVTGTVSEQRCHVHISLAKADLSVVGGHLAYGCIVNTTCELMLVKANGWRAVEEYDENTGYNEAVFVRER